MICSAEWERCCLQEARSMDPIARAAFLAQTFGKAYGRNMRAWPTLPDRSVAARRRRIDAALSKHRRYS